MAEMSQALLAMREDANLLERIWADAIIGVPTAED
jgi:hypothetical protein